MAKRRRLIPSPLGAGFDTGDAADATGTAPEVKSLLRPGLTGGLTGGLAAGLAGGPPIAQVAGSAATQAALDEVAGAMARARTEGRLVLALPLAAVDIDHLVRDRIAVDEAELGHLAASIRAHGQRSPIEVTDLGEVPGGGGGAGGGTGGRYGLISGWRRVQALRRLAEETGDPQFGTVLALLRRPAEASDAYIAMVEENEVRQGLSYYERARIAARAVDLAVFETQKQALQQLFAAASRARRSKIGSFLAIYRQLDTALRFPATIPERLGLALAAALEARPAEAAALRADLMANPAADATAEQARLARFATGKAAPDMAADGTADGAGDIVPRLRQELRPGIWLEVSGGFSKPVLTLSGPAVDPGFRARLEAWLTTGH